MVNNFVCVFVFEVLFEVVLSENVRAVAVERAFVSHMLFGMACELVCYRMGFCTLVVVGRGPGVFLM